MVGGILLLAVVIFSISVLFGKGKVENYYKFLIWLIFALWFWLGLPLWIQILSILLVPFLVSALLRIMFPKAKWLQGLQAIIFQTLIYSVTFPFRFLWRAGIFLLQRERRAVQLNPHRPVVGNRPPVISGRDRRENQNNLFD